MRHIISLLLENEPGALSRVAGLFSARGYNIESLCVAPTADQSVSRMTLVTVGSDRIIEQITKQLHKLVEVIRLSSLTEDAHIQREIALAKVHAVGARRDEILRLVSIFRGHVIDVSPTTYVIELTGNSDKVDHFIGLFDARDVLEVVRSGPLAIARLEKKLSLKESAAAQSSLTASSTASSKG